MTNFKDILETTFCSKIAQEGKNCPRLSLSQKVNPNANSCSAEVAGQNQERLVQKSAVSAVVAEIPQSTYKWRTLKNRHYHSLNMPFILSS